jgi:hypothetical protein
MLSPDCKSTSVCMPSVDKKVDIPTKLIDLIVQGIQYADRKFLLPSEHLTVMICNITSSHILDDLKNGFGELFT